MQASTLTHAQMHTSVPQHSKTTLKTPDSVAVMNCILTYTSLVHTGIVHHFNFLEENISSHIEKNMNVPDEHKAGESDDFIGQLQCTFSLFESNVLIPY